MSYPPPPGLNPSQTASTSSTTPAHASLPRRPPPPAGAPPSFKQASSAAPTFSSAPGTGGHNATTNRGGAASKPAGFGGFTGFQPRSVTASAQPFRTHSPAISAAPAPPTGFSAPQVSYSNNAYKSQPSYSQSAAPLYPNATPTYQESYADPTPLQIRNPFPLPGQTSGAAQGRGQEVDPEMEAQIAQWQSAYIGKDDNPSSTSKPTARTSYNKDGPGGPSSSGANTAPLGVRPEVQGASLTHSALSSAANADTGVAAVVTGADGKQKTVVRSGGGQTWQDPSLLEWDPAHFRLFVGNLAGEVTDESLLKAFAKYPSVQKARVVRDKRTTKSKGYGFVSFIDGEEYFLAARDMQGKYIGSHPVLLRKSTTEIKATVSHDSKRKGKGGKGGGAGGGGGGGGGGRDRVLDGGVSKKGGKTKGGLRLLG